VFSYANIAYLPIMAGRTPNPHYPFSRIVEPVYSVNVFDTVTPIIIYYITKKHYFIIIIKIIGGVFKKKFNFAHTITIKTIPMQ